MTDDVPELRSLVKRFWAPLLAEHGLTEVDASNDEGEFQRVIFASAECQVKFVYERGATEISFGRANAPRGYLDTFNGQRVWFSQLSVFDYEDYIHPGQAYRLPPSAPLEETDDEAFLRTTAALTKPYMARVVAAFSSRPPDGWWAGFRYHEARERARFSEAAILEGEQR